MLRVITSVCLHTRDRVSATPPGLPVARLGVLWTLNVCKWSLLLWPPGPLSPSGTPEDVPKRKGVRQNHVA